MQVTIHKKGAAFADQIMDIEKTGKFIASLRKAKGMTQQQLADILGLSNKAVSKWETGEGLPDVALLPSLAKAIGVSVDELLNGERKPTADLKVEQVANKKTLDNTFAICKIISMFLCVSGAILGDFNVAYCYASFRTLFYTHWEIIFDAAAFGAICLANLLFYVSAKRLEILYEQIQKLKMTYKTAIALAVISSSFAVAFCARIINRYVDLSITVALAAGFIGVCIILAAILISRKIGRKLADEKE